MRQYEGIYKNQQKSHVARAEGDATNVDAARLTARVRVGGRSGGRCLMDMGVNKAVVRFKDRREREHVRFFNQIGRVRC